VAERKPPLEQRIAERHFDDPEVVEALDGMTIEAVCRTLAGPYDDGQPSSYRHFAEGSGGWLAGDPRPGLADDDPAVMQAIGRCAAYRIRLKLPPMVFVAASHPRDCAWCSYPVAELLRVCDWATITARLLVTEDLTWWRWPLEDVGRRDLSYHRAGLGDVYLEPAHAAFWALPRADREARTVAAQYPERAA
jgi:hypothetical protein